MIEEAIEPFRANGYKVDFRVYVFRDKVLYIYPRRNAPGCVTTNISQGGKGRPGIMKKVPVSVVRKIERQALKAVKVLGLGFAGVDIIVDRDMKKAYVVDINMFPGFPKRRTFNLARKIIDAIAGDA